MSVGTVGFLTPNGRAVRVTVENEDDVAVEDYGVVLAAGLVGMEELPTGETLIPWSRVTFLNNPNRNILP